MDKETSEMFSEKELYKIYLDVDRTASQAKDFIAGMIYAAFSSKHISEKEKNEIESLNWELYDRFKYSDNDE